MNVIIERSIVIPRKFLEQYGSDGECVHIGRTLASSLGLLGLDGQVDKGYYVKIPAIAQCVEALSAAASNEESGAIMLAHAYKYSLNPDQLGLIILNNGGIRFLSYVES